MIAEILSEMGNHTRHHVCGSKDVRFLGATWEGFVNTSPTTNSSLLHQFSTDTERSINVSFSRTTRLLPWPQL